ncbi:MAG: hypothetical protein V4607_01975 [Pseudomonadota bacterium]
MLARTLYPYDDGEDGSVRTTRRDVETWLDELEHECCVERYEIDGADYIQVCNWLNHQKIDKPTKSKISPPGESSRRVARIIEASSTEGKGSSLLEGSGKEGMVAPADAAAPPLEFSLTDDPAHVEQRGKVATKTETRTAATWAAYATAYRAAYGVDPVRNRTVNAQLSSFINRVGEAEAPEISAFYIKHPSAYYRSRGHSVGCLLQDAEKLRTEWATNRVTTTTQARQQERTASNPFAKMAEGMPQGEDHGAE